MIIRPIKKEDAAQIRDMAHSLADGVGMNISSIDFTDSEKLIDGLGVFDHMLVLETETPPVEICAALLLRVNPQIYLRRCATFEVMVAPKWQGQGIGKALIGSALELADRELMMERVEVEIGTDNVNALKLCKSLGFKVEGTAKDWALGADGKFIDAYLLARCKPIK